MSVLVLLGQIYIVILALITIVGLLFFAVQMILMAFFD